MAGTQNCGGSLVAEGGSCNVVGDRKKSFVGLVVVVGMKAKKDSNSNSNWNSI